MLEIQIEHQPPNFAPGDTINGSVRTSELPTNTVKMAIRLLWYTTGKGTRDVHTSHEIVHPLGTAPVTLPFQFTAPHRPLSFSGQLISLQWAVEVVLFPSMQTTLTEIVITHNQAELTLPDASEQLKQLGIRKPWIALNQ